MVSAWVRYGAYGVYLNEHVIQFNCSACTWTNILYDFNAYGAAFTKTSQKAKHYLCSVLNWKKICTLLLINHQNSYSKYSLTRWARLKSRRMKAASWLGRRWERPLTDSVRPPQNSLGGFRSRPQINHCKTIFSYQFITVWPKLLNIIHVTIMKVRKKET